jgi:uncharacterized protein involved in exopolysaccharide biosynthesis
MNPLTARWIFCTGLCFLAACAVLPEPLAAAVEAPAVARPVLTPEMTLARVVRERAQLSSLYGPRHPAMIEAEAAETSLRHAMRSAGSEHYRRDLIRALSAELAEARYQRRVLIAQYGEDHPGLLSAETAVRALTAAINAEVRASS